MGNMKITPKIILLVQSDIQNFESDEINTVGQLVFQSDECLNSMRFQTERIIQRAASYHCGADGLFFYLPFAAQVLKPGVFFCSLYWLDQPLSNGISQPGVTDGNNICSHGRLGLQPTCSRCQGQIRKNGIKTPTELGDQLQPLPMDLNEIL